jgi:hypothetical protein
MHGIEPGIWRRCQLPCAYGGSAECKYLEVAVKRITSRVGILSAVGALALAGSLIQTAVANATVYPGNWALAAEGGASTQTPMHATNSTKEASTCVTVNKLSGIGGEWSFQLIWYDGGKDLVLYQSGDHAGKGTACSPIKKPGANDKVYDNIVLFNGGAGNVVQDSGTYSINNH